MHHEVVEHPLLRLTGLTRRVHPSTDMTTIGGLWTEVLGGALDHVPGRIDTHTLVAAYFDYESDETEAYSLMLGVPVDPEIGSPPATAFETSVSDRRGLVHRVFEAGPMAAFVVRGRLPNVIQQTWSSIHTSTLQRSFSTDYERYDLRVLQPEATVEFFIAIERPVAQVP